MNSLLNIGVDLDVSDCVCDSQILPMQPFKQVYWLTKACVYICTLVIEQVVSPVSFSIHSLTCSLTNTPVEALVERKCM